MLKHSAIIQTRVLLAGAASLVALAVGGCGGGNVTGPGGFGGGGAPGGGGNGVSFTTALFALQGATRDNHIGEVDRATLNEARADFQALVNTNPNDTQSRAGLGLSELALAALDGDACVASVLTSDSAVNGQTTAQQLLNIADANDAVGASVSVSTSISLLAGVAKSIALPLAGAGNSAGLQSCITNNVLAKLTEAAADLNAAAADPAAAIKFSDASNVGNTLRSADLKLLASGAETLAGLVGTSTAYNLNAGNFYNGKNFTNPTTFDTNPADGKLTPSEYVAPAPYATLTAGGKTQMAAALVALRAGVNDASTGANAKLAETNSADEAAPTAGLSGALNAALGQITNLHAALLRQFTFPGTDITTNLTAYFNNPIVDMHTAAPTLTVNPITLKIAPVQPLPNPTFNGLFPNGLPTAFFQ